MINQALCRIFLFYFSVVARHLVRQVDDVALYFRVPDSSIKNTGGRPVVLITNSGCLSLLSKTPLLVPRMSESSRAPSISLAPDTQNNLLPPSYHRDVLMRLNGHLNHCCLCVSVVVTPLSFYKFEFL